MNVFEIVAEPIRFRIIEILASGEHQCANLCDVISHEFGVSRTATLHHLRVLREHGYIIDRRDWDERPETWYRLDGALLDDLRQKLGSLRRLWKLRVGWNESTDHMARWWGAQARAAAPQKLIPSKRGRRGHGIDPDTDWFRRKAADDQCTSRARDRP